MNAYLTKFASTLTLSLRYRKTMRNLEDKVYSIMVARGEFLRILGFGLRQLCSLTFHPKRLSICRGSTGRLTTFQKKFSALAKLNWAKSISDWSNFSSVLSKSEFQKTHFHSSISSNQCFSSKFWTTIRISENSLSILISFSKNEKSTRFWTELPNSRCKKMCAHFRLKMAVSGRTVLAFLPDLGSVRI